MPDKKYITASCVISKGVVYRNGISLFTNTELALSEFLLAAYRHFDFKYPKFYKMDNLSKLGWLASELIMQDGPEPGHYQPEEIGLVFSNASASLDTDIKYYDTVKEIASPALFVYTLPNIVMGEICIRHQFKGENAFFISEKFDAAFIQQYVNNLFNNNTLQACICGWVEVLEDQYKTVLFLVENKNALETASGNCITFTTENLLKTYQTENG